MHHAAGLHGEGPHAAHLGNQLPRVVTHNPGLHGRECVKRSEDEPIPHGSRRVRTASHTQQPREADTSCRTDTVPTRPQCTAVSGLLASTKEIPSPRVHRGAWQA